ncbi:MAG: hypothetical protein ACFE9Q_15695 [Candidatus Hodarchaeota archaeon]
MTTIISEDCLIFYGLSPEITKFHQVFREISDFMKNKQKIDPSGRFNFILFLNNGPNYLDHFTLNLEYALKTLKVLSNDIINPNIVKGIIIAISLLIENFKKTSKKLFRLLVLLDDSTYKNLPQEFFIIEKLVKNVRDLPFYIDIVSIEKKNNEDNKLLKKIATSCNGEFYQIKEVNELNPLLKILANKKIKTDYLYSRYKLKIAQGETQTFYISLADKLEMFHERAICSICSQEDNKDIMQCPSCGILAHKACWARWAINLNRLVPYIFRCHNCFYLLKLDKDFVIDIQLETISPSIKLNDIKKKEINDYLEELESSIEPKIIKAEDPMASEIKAIIKSKKSNSESTEEEFIPSVDICPICNNIIYDNEKLCDICGFILSEI